MTGRARGLLVAGTSSDAGKSVVTSALCRAMARRGIRVAPFKAQNMSNNSMVVPGPDGQGAEIGRAQWVQALAARAEPETAMNPVLLKPGSDLRSHVVVRGRPFGRLAAGEFAGERAALARAAHTALEDLRSRYDVVVCEGAGGVAEINLRAHDYVNMGLARAADLPVVVVGDIDRGGVFASLYGSLALLDPADQALVSGFVINKFRGDVSLLGPGLDALGRMTGRPVLGVLPWQRNLWLDSEDSLALADREHDPAATPVLRVAVVQLPRISNFTDVDALCLEPDLRVDFVTDPRPLASADVVVLPGTRATLSDLEWLRSRGLDTAIAEHARRGRTVLGVCGGCQMLGRAIHDPEGVEGAAGRRADGLGLLDLETVFTRDKVLRLPSGEGLGVPVGGYEIHHGRIRAGRGEPFPGGLRDGTVFGTMWHGSLEHDAFRGAWLEAAAETAGAEGGRFGKVGFTAAREARLDLLADLVEEHLDMDAVLRLVTDGAPALPTLRGELR
ncbi:cobyric acid synthase [Thermobifida halotolerans]|uniref:Cobyric acid synthase n=1 Tax=Thermobifida halotolerans TaxID=483545 RepID=A0A399FYR8_9ACTN|nr:cobyric acid synthase [Thermobifida halotolerans]UOE19374.1 cobyric acid synthase [Thermobifida halotolerans]